MGKNRPFISPVKTGLSRRPQVWLPEMYCRQPFSCEESSSPIQAVRCCMGLMRPNTNIRTRTACSIVAAATIRKGTAALRMLFLIHQIIESGRQLKSSRSSAIRSNDTHRASIFMTPWESMVTVRYKSIQAPRARRDAYKRCRENLRFIVSVKLWGNTDILHFNDYRIWPFSVIVYALGPHHR
jgi:hypothetical protein